MRKLPASLAIFLIIVPALIAEVIHVKYWDTTIDSDGYGYYAYLPCAFIYHQFNYQKVMDEEKKVRPNMSADEINYPFIPVDQQKRTDKYFVGVSLLLVPFFLLSYFLSYLFGYELNGYSVLFQEGVALGALFYLVLGFIYIRKLMLEYQVSDKIIYFSLIVILYGTNLYYYAIHIPSMSHVYSFGLQAVFLYYVKKSIQIPRTRNLLVSSILLGILFIIRPTNILSIAAIPFLAGDMKSFKYFTLNILNFRKIALMLICLFPILSIQFLKWHAETGKWYIWGYKGESFDFTNPHIFNILFSYRKGWFLYTPLMFIILTGSLLLFLYQRKFFKAAGIFFFFILTTYVCSSWREWWYGGSLGMRVFVDYYAFYSLLLGIVIMEIRNVILKNTVILLSVLCLILSVIQTIQYNRLIFSWDQMNKKRYWEVFLKTGSQYGWMYEEPSSKLSLFDRPVFYRDFQNNLVSGFNWNGVSFNGSPSLLLSASSGNTLIYALKGSEIPESTGIWIYLFLWGNTDQLENDGCLITRVKSPDGEIHDINTHYLIDEMAATGEWDRIKYIFALPQSILPDDSIKIYAKCPEGSISVDNILIRFGTKISRVPSF